MEPEVALSYTLSLALLRATYLHQLNIRATQHLPDSHSLQFIIQHFSDIRQFQYHNTSHIVHQSDLTIMNPKTDLEAFLEPPSYQPKKTSEARFSPDKRFHFTLMMLILAYEITILIVESLDYTPKNLVEREILA